jgi:hypothetical protein
LAMPAKLPLAVEEVVHVLPSKLRYVRSTSALRGVALRTQL